MPIHKYMVASLFISASVASNAMGQLAQTDKKIPVKSCDEVVNEYLKSCLKSCETYKETRKTQCDAACNDSNQLRSRKAQCEASRKAPIACCKKR